MTSLNELDAAAQTPNSAGAPTTRRPSRSTIGRKPANTPGSGVPPAPPGEATEAGEFRPWDTQGATLRVNERRAKRGLYAPSLAGAPTTTRQAGILNTAIIAPPTGHEGVAAGRDVLSQTAISHDSITAYNMTPRTVTSPNAVNIGDVGSGKTSCAMTVDVVRPLILADRAAVVFDKKTSGADQSYGEYTPITEFFGGSTIRYTLDGTGARFNLMDRIIAGRNDASSDNQLDFFYSVPSLLRDGRAADEWERKGIRVAYRKLMRAYDSGRTPTLADFTDLLGVMDTAGERSLQGMSAQSAERLHQAGMSMRFVFDDLLDSYGPIFDGETSADVSMDRKLTHIDISQLPETGPLIPMVMTVMNLWALGSMRRRPGVRTNIVFEEAWYLFLDDALARLVQSNQKLSRAMGIANIYNLHKGENDIPPGSPGMAVIQEAQTVRVFHQGRPEAARWCVNTFGLNEQSFEDLQVLPPGHHLLKVGSGSPEIEVEHVRSSAEKILTDTDAALRGRKTAVA